MIIFRELVSSLSPDLVGKSELVSELQRMVLAMLGRTLGETLSD